MNGVPVWRRMMGSGKEAGMKVGFIGEAAPASARYMRSL